MWPFGSWLAPNLRNMRKRRRVAFCFVATVFRRSNCRPLFLVSRVVAAVCSANGFSSRRASQIRILVCITWVRHGSALFFRRSTKDYQAGLLLQFTVPRMGGGRCFLNDLGSFSLVYTLVCGVLGPCQSLFPWLFLPALCSRPCL